MGFTFAIAIAVHILNAFAYMRLKRNEDNFTQQRSSITLFVGCLSSFLYLFLLLWYSSKFAFKKKFITKKIKNKKRWIIGSVWTFSINFYQCDLFVYNVAFFYLIVAWSIFGFSIFLGCFFCLCGVCMANTKWRGMNGLTIPNEKKRKCLFFFWGKKNNVFGKKNTFNLIGFAQIKAPRWFSSSGLKSGYKKKKKFCQ